MKRYATKYPGVFYREARRLGGPGVERVYYVVFKKEGKTIEEKVGRQYADDMTPARAARMRSDRIENKRPSRKEIREDNKAIKWTLNRLWDEFKEYNAYQKSLRQEDARYLKNLKNTFGDKEPKDILPLDVDRLRIKLQKGGKYTTAVRTLELLRRIIYFGVEKKLITPLDFKIKIPRLNNQVTEDLSPDQIKNLLKILNDEKDKRCANLMLIALLTGMRRSEILRLRWDDIDLFRNFIRLRDPKSGQDQTIPLSGVARKVFQQHPRDGNNPLVFPGRKDGHYTGFGDGLRRIKRAAGLPDGFRPLHGLRHVYASMLASSGEVDMYTLQKLLTHKSPKMTQRYAHLRDDALKRAADLAGKLISDTLKPEGDYKEIICD